MPVYPVTQHLARRPDVYLHLGLRVRLNVCDTLGDHLFHIRYKRVDVHFRRHLFCPSLPYSSFPRKRESIHRIVSFVLPAQARIQSSHSSFPRNRESIHRIIAFVLPAQAGIHTSYCLIRPSRASENPIIPFVLPAQAGIHSSHYRFRPSRASENPYIALSHSSFPRKRESNHPIVSFVLLSRLNRM